MQLGLAKEYIHINIDHFEGPLSLLLQLIQKEEMDIRELNLTQVTHQYLLYLQEMKDFNFDVAGEYLLMASTLMYLKSKECLDENTDKEVDESDLLVTSKEELIQRLEELEKFQNLSKVFDVMPQQGVDIFVKPKVNTKELKNSLLTPISVTNLTESMLDYYRRDQRKFHMIKRDRISIREKLIKLKEVLKPGLNTTLDHLVDNKEIKTDVVITFISLLELARLQRLNIYQTQTLGELYIEVLKSLEDFDVESADGFEEEEQAKAPVSKEKVENEQHY